MLKVTFSSSRNGAGITGVSYVPTYAWRYKQDGRYYYRCLAVTGLAPDGMDSDQIKSMNKAEETIRTLLEGTPLTAEQ